MNPLSGTAQDAVGVRVVARFRVAAALAATAPGSFLPHLSTRSSALFLVLGLVWVPWASAIVFASDRTGSKLALYGGPGGDLLALFSVQLLAPRGGEAVLLAYLVVVAFGVYTGGPRFAVVLGVTTVVLTLIAQQLDVGSQRVDFAAIATFAAAVVALLFLFGRTTNLHTEAATRYQLLLTKSDTILENVASGVVVSDAGGCPVQCNPAALRIIGRSEENMVGLPCTEALSLHVGERLLDCSAGCQLLCLADSSDGGLGQEVWRATASGGRQPLLANATAVTSSDGRMEVVHSLRDVTRLKQAEEAKTLFLATASHELKTPLTVINGFAATLARYDDLDAPTKAAALDAIRVRALELTKIVDRLLLSSRIEAGRIRLTIEQVQVGPLVSERVTALAMAMRRRINFTGSEGLPTVQGNVQALVTVVDHLLDNALKYSPNGEPVEVTVVPTEHGVQLRVADHGIGMNVDEAAHCFDRFWQAESTDLRRFGGTGIGLYIVQSLVDAMGGAIEVETAKDVGTTFLLSLSCLQSPPSPRDPGLGESSSIREFMRQIGVPQRSGR